MGKRWVDKMDNGYLEVLYYWFETLKPSDWFQSSPIIDQEIENKFSDIHFKATQGELFNWRTTPEGRLSEIIVLDQFSRNIYRNKPKAFAQDHLALFLAQEMVYLGWDLEIGISQRSFVYMPYMHSESLMVHQEAVNLFNQPGLEYNYNYELLHKNIIDRFGRFPHRNKVLGRKSSVEEEEFLLMPGSSF